MKHYESCGFGEDIKALPEAVQTWFLNRYNDFKSDISYPNDSWPTFYIGQHCDEDDCIRPVVFCISGRDLGDEGRPGYKIMLAQYDDRGGFGVDGNEDILLNEEAEIDDLHWTDMMAMVDTLMNK